MGNPPTELPWLSYDDVLALQRLAGNHATSALLEGRLRRPDVLGPESAPLRLEPTLKWFPDLPQQVHVEEDFPYVKNLAAGIHKPDDYSRQVKKIFGSYDAYLAFAPKSDAELDTPVGSRGKTLRSLIEHGDKGNQTQNVFYRWVRWEYVQQGLDPLKTILSGMTPDLRRRLDAAGKALGVHIKAGGFNPRPMKNARKQIILGTLSEHATGNAVDIDDKNNLILSPEAWAFIEKATGSGAVHHSRKRWETDPEGLYDDIVALSAAWQKTSAEMVQAEADRRLARQQAERHSGTLLPGNLRRPAILHDFGPALLLGPEDAPRRSAKRPAPEESDLILAALASVPNMPAADKEQSVHGLMTHSRALVLQLRRQGLLWGATFSNRDLHHFEIPNVPLPSWPASTGAAPTSP